MKLIQLALGSLVGVAFLASSAASASNLSIGTLPLAPAVFSDLVSEQPGSFSDSFSFTAPSGPSTASGTVTSTDLLPLLDVSGLVLSLYSSSNTLLAQGSSGDSSSLSGVALSSGASYYFTVTGNAIGSAGGLYAFIASASAVPEPQTYALMLGGVGVVAFLALRRRDWR
jgi:hypothetical protein